MRQMHDGVSETKAVECFGRRCLLQQYLRFCSLITQNMKKGAEGKLARLETEAMDSLERRKEHALQLGEKAGTRLLFPMMLMLLIVMGIFMAPSFMTMGVPAEGKEGTTMRNVIKNYFLEEDAIGVVEIILILVILIALVLIF